MNTLTVGGFSRACIAVLSAAVTLTACGSSKEITVSPSTVTETRYALPETHKMPPERYEVLKECIPLSADAIRDPNEIGMAGLDLPGLRKTIESPECSGDGFVAGSTENVCTILFKDTHGQEGRKGVVVIKARPGGTFDYMLYAEQTGESANRVIGDACNA